MKHVKLFENFDLKNYQLRGEENSETDDNIPRDLSSEERERLSEIAREAMKKGDTETLTQLRKFVEKNFKNDREVKHFPSFEIPNRGAIIPRDFSSNTKEQLKEIAMEAMQKGDIETLIQMSDYLKNNPTI